MQMKEKPGHLGIKVYYVVPRGPVALVLCLIK